MRPTLDPKLDVVFKLLFADARNRSCLRALLTALLNPAESIGSVEVLNPETSRETVVDKGAVLDLRFLNSPRCHAEVLVSKMSRCYAGRSFSQRRPTTNGSNSP